MFFFEKCIYIWNLQGRNQVFQEAQTWFSIKVIDVPIWFFNKPFNELPLKYVVIHQHHTPDHYPSVRYIYINSPLPKKCVLFEFVITMDRITKSRTAITKFINKNKTHIILNSHASMFRNPIKCELYILHPIGCCRHHYDLTKLHNIYIYKTQSQSFVTCVYVRLLCPLYVESFYKINK